MYIMKSAVHGQKVPAWLGLALQQNTITSHGAAASSLWCYTQDWVDFSASSRKAAIANHWGLTAFCSRHGPMWTNVFAALWKGLKTFLSFPSYPPAHPPAPKELLLKQCILTLFTQTKHLWAFTTTQGWARHQQELGMAVLEELQKCWAVQLH